jgi:hypothetical protein
MYFHTDTIEIFGRRNAAGESNSRTDRIGEWWTYVRNLLLGSDSTDSNF